MGELDRWPHVGSAVIVLDTQGRILLGRRDKPGCPAHGQWVLPGGGIRPFESIEQAARREVAEETGLALGAICARGHYELFNHQRQHRIVFVGEAHASSGELRAGDDMAEVRYFSPEEAAKLELSPLTRRILEERAIL